MATIRIRIESNQGVVVYVFNEVIIIIITDEQRCADSPGSSNNIVTIAPTVLASVYMLLLHKHKIINIK